MEKLIWVFNINWNIIIITSIANLISYSNTLDLNFDQGLGFGEIPVDIM